MLRRRDLRLPDDATGRYVCVWTRGISQEQDPSDWACVSATYTEPDLTMDSTGTRRLLTVSPSDHSPWLWVTSILSLIYALMVLGCRLLVKWGVLGLDDAALGVAYVRQRARPLEPATFANYAQAFGLIHWGLIYAALHRGLGKATTLVPLEAEQHAATVLYTRSFLISPTLIRFAFQLVFASRIFLHLALCFSRISILGFMRNIFTRDMKKAWMVCNILIGLSITWAVAAALIVSVGCHPSMLLRAEPDACCPDNVSTSSPQHWEDLQKRTGC